MVFAHDTETSLLAGVALVNSAASPDTLTTTDQLADFYTEHDYTGAFACDRSELDAVRALRPELRVLLTSPRDGAVAVVNQILSDAEALPQLVRHGPTDWHLHAVESDAPFHTRIAVETAMAMIDVIRTDELSRLGTCVGTKCDGLVLDLSRNRSRRFCSVACGNRAAVAAYRSRQNG